MAGNCIFSGEPLTDLQKRVSRTPCNFESFKYIRRPGDKKVGTPSLELARLNSLREELLEENRDSELTETTRCMNSLWILMLDHAIKTFFCGLRPGKPLTAFRVTTCRKIVLLAAHCDT